MRLYDKLTAQEQHSIKQKFVLPEDTSNLEVDNFNRPFTKVGGKIVICTVKNDNFHLHENKCRRQQ